MTVIDRSSPVETFEFRMAVRLDRGKLPLTRNGVRTRPPFFADERAWTTALIRYLTRFPILSMCRGTRIGQRSVQRSLRQEEQVSNEFHLDREVKPDQWVKAVDMKTKNRSLFSRMCKCYGRKSESRARVHQTEDESTAVPKLSDEVTISRVPGSADLE